MKPSASSSGPRHADATEQQAAQWLALREERELTANESAAFAAWCAADARHQAAVDELAAAWQTFDQLRGYSRLPGAVVDADFLTRRQKRRVNQPVFLAAAAAFVIAAAFWWQAQPAPYPTIAAEPIPVGTGRTLQLPDGSTVEFRAGSEVVPRYTRDERRVWLVRGEAHFTVSKDAARPFVVEADGVAVRAVGTAFNIRLGDAAVEVVVTEGVVSVQSALETAASEGPNVTEGQRVVIEKAPDLKLPRPRVETLAPAEIDRVLAWQTSRLVFDAAPLNEVIARFNRHHSSRIVLKDSSLAALRISGRFHAANVDSFLELLERGFGIAVERRPGEIVLHRAVRR